VPDTFLVSIGDREAQFFAPAREPKSPRRLVHA
jgi:hypothetical protein